MKLRLLSAVLLMITACSMQVATAQPPVIRPTTGGLPNLPGGGRGMPSGAPSDSLRRRSTTDSLRLRFYYPDSTQAYLLDSSINDFTRRFTLPATFVSLGNTGSPARSLLFRPQNTAGWDAGFHALDAYRIKLQQVKFYNTNRPYTELNYLLGTKAEQVIEVLHTQNIQPSWNASFHYRLISAPGIFRNQKTAHNNYTFTSWYQSPQRRYHNYFVFLFNKLQAGENGGIKTDKDYLNNPVYGRDRFTVPTKLGGEPRFGTDFFSTALYTGRRETDMNFFLRQQYDFGRKDSLVLDTVVVPLFFPRVRLQHDLTISRLGFRFQDFAVSDGKQSNLPDSAYYQNHYQIKLLNDSLLLQDKWTVVANDFSIYQYPDEKNLHQFFKLGAGFQWLRGELKASKTWYNIIAHGEYRNRTKNQQWDMMANGRLYLGGLNAGDYQAFVSLQRMFAAGRGSLRLGFENINSSPSFIYRPESQFYLDTAKDFAKQNISHFFASLTEPKTGIELSGAYYLVSNYLYLKEFYKLQQENALFNVLRVGASQTFRLGRHWNWYADVYLQQKTGAVELNLPLFFTRNRLAFEGNFFRNLNLSTGIEMRYHSPYKADNYSPVLGHFFYQDSLTISNRPDVAAFFHVRIRSLKAYLRAENLNTISSTGRFNNHNFVAPDYPTPGLLVRLALYWSFVN